MGLEQGVGQRYVKAPCGSVIPCQCKFVLRPQPSETGRVEQTDIHLVIEERIVHTRIERSRHHPYLILCDRLLRERDH